MASLDPKEEQIIFNTLRDEQSRIERMSVVATPELSARIGSIYKKNPAMPAGVVLASAQAGLPDDIVDQMGNQFAEQKIRDAQLGKPKKEKNWFQRNVYDKLKNVSRYAFAGLELPLQTIQGGAAQLFADNPDGIDGWFISTDLGSLIRNDEKAGDGFFLGGEAKTLQQQRVEAYRGKTSGGQAWTIGRGLAGVVSTEDSLAYNLMSGLVDGAIAVSVPVLPGFKQAAGAVKAAEQAGKGGKFIRGADVAFDTIRGKGTAIRMSEMTGEELKNLRFYAGLNGQTIDPVVANKWMGTRQYLAIREKLVQANTIDDVRGAIGDKVFVSTAKRLRDATTNNQVDEIMADILGVAQEGLVRTVMPGTRKFSLSNARRVQVIDSLAGAFEDTKFGRIATRAFENRPMRNIVDFSSESESDVLRTVNDIDRWLKAALIKDLPETVTRNGVSITMPGRVQFLDEVVDALSGPNATRTARRQVKERFQDMMKEALIRNGNNDAEVVSAVFDYHKGWARKTSNFNVSLNATVDDGAMYMGIHGPKIVQQGAFGGPLLQSELADVMIEMPDVDQFRALTGRWNRLWRKRPTAEGLDMYEDANIQRLSEAGRLRLPLAVIRNLQENVFKKIVLATGGYGIRNVMEGQVSLALSQKPVTSIFRHPLQHMQWVAHEFSPNGVGRIGRLGIGDLMGEQWTDDIAIESMRQYKKATGEAVSSHYKNPTTLYRRGMRTGDFKTVRRGFDEKAAIVSAHADQVGRLNADPVMRQLASGMSDDELLDFIRTTDEGKAWFRDQQDYHINGRHVFDTSGPTPQWAGTQSVDLNDEHNLRMLLQSYRNRYNIVAGSHDNLRIAIQTGLLEPRQLTPDDISLNNLTPQDAGTVKQITIGNRVIDARVDPNDYTIVRPFAFRQGEATKELEDLLGRTGPGGIYDDATLAQEMVYEARASARVGKRGLNEAWDDTTDRLFGWLAGKPLKYLERSPAFRQRYYSWAIDEMITSLSPADLDAMILRIENAAQIAGVSPSRYVGDHPQFSDITRRLFGATQRPGDRWERILELQQNPSRLKGTLTLEEIDEFAKGQAADDLSRMVYDASERTNLMDVARFLVPFGQAQVEFFRRMSRIYTIETGGIPLPNLSALRKTQLIVENGREADPDGNGRGFFFTDAQTGEWSFTYPLTDKLTHLATGGIGGGPGVTSTWQAPVKGALMGLDVRPGLGPFAQIGGTILLRDQPTYDWARSLFLPYGELDIAGNKGIAGTVADSLTPAWAKKLQSAFFDSPESQTTYGNTFFETYQALAASGQYDLASAEDKLRLSEDATGKARFLTVIRAIGQWLGPSRPTNKLSVDTLKGDVFVNLLAQDLRERQLQDYDTAISSWLDDYGEDVFVYLSGKTKAVAGGLTASSEFGNFERANKGFFKKYNEVAGFFAPGGTDLDWQVYTRQLEKGARERLTTEESLAAAQRYIAYKKYRSLQEFIGPYPKAEQREYLARYREYLGELYPGFQYAAFDPNELRRRIEKLKDAANDPEMADNRVADAARRYLQTRDYVYQEAAKLGLKSIEKAKGAEQLRGYLREYADVLVREVPEFERLYNQLLQQEVDE
jgi:hypothetical protein